MYDAIKQAFVQYVNLEFPVIPICPHKHQRMTATHRDKCKYPGKVPLIGNWSQHDKTTLDHVSKWVSDNPFINIGLPMGQNSGMVGIDIDGTYGEKQLQAHSKGDLPETWEFNTSGGRRLLYKIPPGVKTKKVKDFNEDEKHAELAILCDGQQTVLPPSIHKSGFIYAWAEGKSPWETDIADAPSWLLMLCAVDYDDTKEIPPATLENQDWKQDVPEGGRSNHLVRLAGSLVSRRNIPKEEVVLFVDAWNREHCSPPLPLTEIEKMVNSIATSEAAKAKKRDARKAKKASFLSTPVATKFIEAQKKAGLSWQFAVDQGSFYRCDDLKGPWERMDMVLVQKYVREALLQESEDWDTVHYVNEVIAALRERLSGSVVGRFDIGQHATEHESVISVQNGLLEWRSKELKPWTPELYTTLQMAVKWNPEATCPIWNKVLAEWVPDEESRRFLQEYVGLCLIPDSSFRLAVFLYGVGANGKSLFLEVIRGLFGSSSLTSIPLHRLADRFEVASLQNKLINICGDIDAKYLSDTGLLKALIGGDSLRGEFKHGKSFDFIPVARLMFSANTLPRVSDKSAAWYSRWKFIHFPNQFPVNSSYKIELLEQLDKEKEGILKWAVEGLQRLKTSNKFTQSETMTQSEVVYRADNDNVLAFCMEAVQHVEHEGVETLLASTPLYHVYKEWAEEQGAKAVGQIEFSKRLQMLGFKKDRRSHKNKSTICFLGIQFKEDDWQKAYNFFEGVRNQR